MPFESGLADGAAGWAIDLQNLLNRNNPNVGRGLQPYIDMRDALHKKYPGAYLSGDLAGMAGSGLMYGVPSAAEDAATGAVTRRAATEAAAAAEETAGQASPAADWLGNPRLAALDKAQADKLAQEALQGYTQGVGAEDDAYAAYLRMMDEAEQASQSGMNARDFARSKGVPSIRRGYS